MTRTLDERETIIAIAESYKAVEESCLAKGLKGHGNGYPKMANAWNEGTYAEFAWCLVKMHHQGRQYAYMGESWRTLRAHIVMYWINVEKVQRMTPERRVMVGKGRKKKSMLVAPEPYIQIVRHKHANEQKAKWGIDVVQMIWPRQEPRRRNDQGNVIDWRAPWLPTEVFETVLDNKLAA